MVALATPHFMIKSYHQGALEWRPRTLLIPNLTPLSAAYQGLRQLKPVDCLQMRATTRSTPRQCGRAVNCGGAISCSTGMNLVYVGTETGPHSKTGGLGDVLGGLPPAMAARGHRVMVVTPRYDQYKDAWDTGVVAEIKVGDKIETVRFFHLYKRGVDRVFIDHPWFLEKVWGKTGGKLYGPVTGTDYDDNQLRFSLLCLAALEAPRVLNLNNSEYFSGPYGEDVVFIANDWHTGPLSCYLKSMYKSVGIYKNAKVAFCIHNIAYQGRFPFADFSLLNLPDKFKSSFDFFDGYLKPVKGRPILSLTGTSDFSSDGEHVVRVSCVQPQAIQQYALDVFQCLPPLVDNDEDANESSISRVLKVSGSQGFSVPEQSFVPTSHDLPIGISSPNCPTPVSSYESSPLARFPSQDFATTNVVHKLSAPPLLGTNTDISHVTSSPAPVNLELPKCTTALGTFPTDFDPGHPLGNHEADQKTLDYSVVNANMSTVTSVDNNFRKEESKGGLEDLSKVPNSTMMFIPGGSTTHLITPAEILSGATSSSESSLVIQDLESEGAKIQDATGNTHVEQQVVVCESGSTQDGECVSRKESHFASAENIKNSNSSQTLKAGIEVDNDSCTLERESCSLEKARPVDSTVGTETLDQTLNVGEDVQDATNSFSEKAIETATSTTILQPLAGNGTNQMTNSFPGSAVSTPFTSPFTSTNSSNVPENSCPADAAVSQLKSLQDMLSQLMTMQKETHQKISAMVSAPITKEGRRVEVALGRSMEKAIKANVDALWGNFQEENAKHEKIEKDRIQQVTSVVTNFVNKDLPAMLERTIKKEISGVAPVISRAVTPAIEKSVSSAIADSFQRGVGDKAVNQLEKSVNSKLEATVARQIQSQFQTSGKQALQDGLRSSLESKAIPAFENSCKAMFEQVNAAFQKGMAEHTAAALEQVESAHTPLASTLREAIGSASSITQNLANELADGQRKILALITAGNTQALNPMAMQLSNSLPGVHLEMLEKPLDPKKELTRLISERKFEEAFTLALQRSDVSIVSWLCSQVDLHGIGPLSSLSLSQGVLLSLLQQLACDISNEASKKVGWMRDVAVAINLTDPMIRPHVRPIFEQVYSRLLHHRSIPTTTTSEATGIQVTMHVINSLLMSCK